MLDKKCNFALCIIKIDAEAICEFRFACCFKIHSNLNIFSLVVHPWIRLKFSRFWLPWSIPYEKKVLASIGSNTFFTIKYWKFSKKVLDPILINTFFLYGINRSGINKDDRRFIILTVVKKRIRAPSLLYHTLRS